MLTLILKGGWVIFPLLLCSIFSVAVILERLLFFRRATARAAADEFLALVHNGQIREAMELAKNGTAPILKVLEQGIAHHASNPGKAMEAAGIAAVAAMKRGLPILDTIITLSPLLGLLGTIIGMINSFQVMSTVGMGQPHAVTGGVAEALIATATGITVAVVSLIPYNYFLTRVERETEVIEQYATRLELEVGSRARGEKYEDTKKYA